MSTRGSLQRALASMFASPMRFSREQSRELFAVVQEQLLKENALNRDESGADRPGDPDSGGDAQDVRVLFTMVGERPHADPSQISPSPDSRIAP